ncbi:hypothetical protein CFC21_004439 [Triticum aestivum]|uniref:Uncharacterized protein n=3 Tax=Triticum TaxID=4564 RepID=A0A9R0QH65_TRITD|nr:hypothetical protein CFC21_004439 [Triticum aestivum]VAH11521.1 unnamed protein product [Triticum turgidum subsp. durum]
MDASPPSSPSQLTPESGLSTPPPHSARMEFATPMASEELGLPIQSTLVHPLQSPPSHSTGLAEPQAVTRSTNGSPTVVGSLGMALTPTSPPSVVSSFGIIAPASLTPTPMSLWHSGSHPVAADDSTSTDEDSTMQRQASHNLDYSEDAGPSVVINVQNELHSSGDGVIPKVRANLRRVAADLFTPYAVPIGPYHESADSWQWTEAKKRAVRDLVSVVNLSGLERVMDRVQYRARGYYTHLPEPDDHAGDSAKFSRMLLLDGCYLVSLFVDCYQREEATGSPSSRSIVYRDNTVVRDILYLLENQIPLFVINEILNYMRAPGEVTSAVECIARPVEELLQRQLYISKTPREAPSTSVHLLGLVYCYMASPLQQQQQQQPQPQERTSGLLTGPWRRATEYRRYANLLFKRRAFGAGEEWSILDVELDGGNLRIPLLRVDSNTWTVLRNLMALEEQQEARPVTAYCYFMSQVACTAEDVGLLRSAMVVEHFLGSDESAAQGFACLCHGMALDIHNLQRNYLKPIWHAVEKRCGVPAHNFKGFFREKYCGNIFYRVVFFIAILVFVSQMVQSIYAVIAYHRPNTPPSRVLA